MLAAGNPERSGPDVVSAVDEAPTEEPASAPAGRSARLLGPVRRHPGWSGAVVAVVLVGAGVGSYFAVSGSSASAATATTTTTTETISTGTIRQAVSASGTLAPAQDQTLSFSSSGVVTSVLVAEGQAVTKGQAMATINSASLAASLAQAQATVATDQAKVDSDQTNSASAAQLAADQAALTAAQNQVTSAQAALAGATLTSPIDGVVASVGLSVGQSVSGSGSSGGGASGSSGSSSSSTASGSIEVISTNSWIVNATVDATSVDLIKAGNQAQLAVTGASATVYGTISSIAVTSSSTSGTASYPVVIAVTGSPTGLHDGQSVTASLIYKQLADVVVVPVNALHRDATGTYVNKIVSGKVVKTPVTIGISSGLQTQITAGLAAGDQVQVQTTTRTGNSPTTTRTGINGRTGTGGGNGGYFPGGGGGFVGGQNGKPTSVTGGGNVGG
jgi:multidrug efflux pump subunit AcrA (membrane-fusion protein)